MLRPVIAAGVSASGLYLYDEYRNYGVVARSARAIQTGLFVFVHYKFLWTPENSSSIHAKVGRRIADTCLKNEGLYVKFGQVLSSLNFVLPPEYIGPLSELQDNAMTYDESIVIDIIKTANPTCELSNFNGKAIASASVAQVHTATVNGRKVAVKVQKPNISVQANWDLRLYWWILRGLEYSFELPITWTYEFTKEQLLGELDFRTEAANSNLSRDQFMKSPLRDHVYIPEILFSSERVLISEWVDGVKISDVEGIRKLGMNPSQAILYAVSALSYQVFFTGHVHCDPHPGNLLVRKDQIILIDHGLYTELSDDLRRDYARLWVAMIPPRDTKAMQEICENWGIKDFELYSKMISFSHGKARTERSAEEAKQRIKNLLNDTNKYPRPLLFVGRSLNYIRSANLAHGAPIDRVAVMMKYASKSLGQEQSQRSYIFAFLKMFGFS